MALNVKLPGQRKGNRFCIIRGRVRGKEYEFCTNTVDPQVARTRAERIQREIEHGGSPRERVTFAQAAEGYLNARDPSASNRRYIERLGHHFAHRWLDAITPGDIDLAAAALYPGRLNETKNRQVHAPMAAILHYAHYASKGRWCDYLVVRKLDERQPAPRRIKPELLDILVAEADKGDDFELWLLLLHLRYQGWRISETLGLAADNIDLDDGVFLLWVSKAKKWKRIPMHPEVAKAFRARHRLGFEGRPFRWHSRAGVYGVLKPLCRKVGIKFTPHMARHNFASELDERDTPIGAIRKAGSWTADKSVARYIDDDLERSRQVISRLGARANSRGKAAK